MEVYFYLFIITYKAKVTNIIIYVYRYKKNTLGYKLINK